MKEIIAAHVRDLWICADETTGPHVSNDSRQCPVCHSQVMPLARALEVLGERRATNVDSDS